MLIRRADATDSTRRLVASASQAVRVDLPDDLAEQIEAYRAHRALKATAEAIRELLTKGLSVDARCSTASRAGWAKRRAEGRATNDGARISRYQRLGIVGPTVLVLRALAEGPKTRPELEDVLTDSPTELGSIVWRQKQLGNLTRVDGPSGMPAVYALTEVGREKIGL